MEATRSARRRLATLAVAFSLTAGLTTVASPEPVSATIIGGNLYCDQYGNAAVHGVRTTERATGEYTIVEWFWWDHDAQVWRTFWGQWHDWPFFDSPPSVSFHAKGYAWFAARVWEWHPLRGYAAPYWVRAIGGSYHCRTY